MTRGSPLRRCSEPQVDPPHTAAEHEWDAQDTKADLNELVGGYTALSDESASASGAYFDNDARRFADPVVLGVIVGGEFGHAVEVAWPRVARGRRSPHPPWNISFCA